MAKISSQNKKARLRPTLRRQLAGALALCLILTVLHCRRVQDAPNVLARVGNEQIKNEEFQLRYQFSPYAFQRASDQARRREFLSSLIAEKLLAQKGRSQGLDQTAHYVAQMTQLRKEALVEALYYERVAPAARARAAARGILDEPALRALESEEMLALLKKVMTGKSMRVSHTLFERLVHEISTVSSELPGLPARTDSSFALREIHVVHMQKHLADYLQEPFIRFADGSAWTLAQVLERLSVGPYRLAPPGSPAFMPSLRRALRQAVELEHLALEAEREGLAATAYVQQQASMWSDALLTQSVLAEASDQASVTDDELWDQYRSHPEAYQGPALVNGRELVVADEQLARSLLQRLQIGEDAATLAAELSQHRRSARTGGETGFLTLGAFGSHAEEVRSARPGTILGPWSYPNNRYVLFQVTEMQAAGLYAFAEVREELAQAVRLNHSRTIYNQLLRDLGRSSDIRIHWQRLDSLQTTGTGTVVMKKHFPGRMLAPIVFPFAQLPDYAQIITDKP